jgi:hypothetical protein
MSEVVKTALYAGIAVLVLLWAFLVRPTPVEVASEIDTGPFFGTFNSLDCTSLEILAYDEDTATPQQFKVAQVDGLFVIPSHENYPADARDHLAAAAASVMGLEKLGLVTQNKADHAEYGVVDPDPAKMQAGATGVGKRVTLEDRSGKKLAQFIIGKAVKGQEELRYVRTPDSDRVYRVKVAVDKLSTKFEDWIEKDLLKLNSWDIVQVVLNNYSVDEVEGKVVPGDTLDLSFNDKDSKWTLADQKPGEELDTQKLNDMKNALDDLKIVDVRRKPAGLTKELSAQEGGSLNREDVMSLAQKGFFLTQQHQLLSNEGEVLCRMKDGILYTLRFGEIATQTGSIDDKEKDKEDKEKGEAPKGDNRYIFVTARFDEDSIEKPELPPLPEEASNEEKPADDAAKKQDEAKPDAAKSDEAGSSGEQKSNEAKPDDKTAGDQPESDEPESKREAAKKRKEIEQQRKKLQDEYDDKIKKGKEREKELNERFAAWYYVISDEVYRKIRLSRSDIVKGGEGSDVTPDALEKIKSEGLKKDPAEPQP